MLERISLRYWYLVVAICCAGLLAFAFYQQYQMFLEPCPLCIFQRIGFIWIGAVALLAAIHNPARVGQWVYSLAMIAGAVLGALVAGRHVWLQNLPPDQVPECGPGLNYMLDTLPLSEVLAKVFLGDGNCAEVHWTFLGLSMPGWTLVWFSGLALVTLWLTVRIR
jgi:disulfide bond formation protein DsbB